MRTETLRFPVRLRRGRAAPFYTLPSSATLLAQLAVARLDIDWSDREAVGALRIGDFACGTGALLNAAYEAVLSRCSILKSLKPRRCRNSF